MEDGPSGVGAVIAPLLGEAWSAAEGEGAFDAEGTRLTVSTHPGAGVVATGFPFRRKERLPRYLPVMTAALRALRGSSPRRRREPRPRLRRRRVRSTGYFELGLGLWDIAAGALLVREAGGVVTDWGGDPDAVFVSGDILAGTPAWHEAMLEIVAA